MKICKFEEMTGEWLDFIVACRVGKPHDYDIVEGPMADDTIYNYIQNFIDGKYSRAAFWELADGDYDNISKCKYAIPDYWDIGEVFARLIEDCYDESDVVNGIREVYDSWLADKILNFNSDLYYQSREYIALCYKEGKIIS